MGWLQAVVGFVVGLAAKFFYDLLKAPSLEILGDVSGPFQIEDPQPAIRMVGSQHVGAQKYWAYRVRVRNRQKKFVNIAAENCLAWLDLDSAFEPYQLSWIGGATVTINVGDRREIDLCARNVQDGLIIAPTETVYFDPRPRKIGDGTQVLSGRLRVTSRNGKQATSDVTIKPIEGGKLEITLKPA